MNKTILETIEAYFHTLSDQKIAARCDIEGTRKEMIRYMLDCAESNLHDDPDTATRLLCEIVNHAIARLGDNPLCCPYCGSHDVVAALQVNPNTNQALDENPADSCFCNGCGEDFERRELARKADFLL